MRLARLVLLPFVFVLAAHAGAHAPQRAITVAATTSFQQSGLFDHLLAAFVPNTGIAVRVKSVGSAEALDMARRGEVDVVVVNDIDAEEQFMAEGYGARRIGLMYDDFVVVGPRADPAQVAGSTDVLDSFRKIAAVSPNFISRRDRSGTQAREMRYWRAAGIDIGWIKGLWYKEIPEGMLPALNAAAIHNAYILSDRSTWSAFQNRRDLALLVEGDPRMFNQYTAILVKPRRRLIAKHAAAGAFVDWLASPEGQQAIANYRIDGQQLFFPNAPQHDSRATRAPDRFFDFRQFRLRASLD